MLIPTAPTTWSLQYFANMLPSACLAYGPGVLPQVRALAIAHKVSNGASARCASGRPQRADRAALLHPPQQVHCGLEMPFLLVARDTAGSKRTSGGDAFEVSLESEAGQVVGSARVVDRGTGVYECFYRCGKSVQAGLFAG